VVEQAIQALQERLFQKEAVPAPVEENV